MKAAPYDPKSDIWDQRRPAVAVDVVLLSILEGQLQIALIQRQDEPYFGKYALPGRFVRYEEPIETTAKKALESKGNIKTEGIYLEQLATFGQNLIRDTRIRTISVVYYALVPKETISDQEGNAFHWFGVEKLPPLAFDHKEIIGSAIARIRKKILASDVVFHLMPQAFTLPELQHTCEILLGETLDKRNFRKKVVEIYTLKDLKRDKREGAHRPARLYSFVKMRE